MHHSPFVVAEGTDWSALEEYMSRLIGLGQIIRPSRMKGENKTGHRAEVQNRSREGAQEMYSKKALPMQQRLDMM
jgi:hypothetical protein